MTETSELAVVEAQSELDSEGATLAQVKKSGGRHEVKIILDEAERGYDLIVLGVSERPGLAWRYHPLIDKVIHSAPCATMVVKAPPAGTQSIQRILVPTVGTQYSNRAVELAAVLGKSLGAEVTLVHVVPQMDHESVLMGRRGGEMHHRFGQRIVDSQADLALHLGSTVSTVVLEGNNPEVSILELARTGDFDLILIGTSLRPMLGRSFLGHRVETLLRDAACAVAVVSSS